MVTSWGAKVYKGLLCDSECWNGCPYSGIHVRATKHSLHIPDAVQSWLRTGAPRLFNHTDLLQPWLISAQILPALAKILHGWAHQDSVGQILPRNAPALLLQAGLWLPSVPPRSKAPRPAGSRSGAPTPYIKEVVGDPRALKKVKAKPAKTRVETKARAKER